MSCKLIMLFLYFEVTIVYCVKTDRVYRNKTLFVQPTFRGNKTVVENFVLLNPRQIQQVEATIKNFLARLIGPVARPITLRLSSPDGGNLQKTVGEICETIRVKIMEFARACGLVASIRQREQISRNFTVSEDWFSESLLQVSLLLCDLVRIGEKILFTIDHYLNTNNATSQKNEESLSRMATRSFRFLSAINDASEFNERLFKCLRQTTNGRKRAFDLNRAFANLTKGSPGSTVKTLKIGLSRAFVHDASSNGTSSNQLHALLCHLLVKRAGNYGDCIKELQRVRTCVSSSRRETINAMVDRTTLTAKPWLAAIEDLSSCKIYIDADGSASVRCNFDRQVPRTTVQQVKYIYENILNRRISRRSPLHHAANELGNVLSRSEWGRQLTYDVCQYFEIHREGRKRLNQISRRAVRNKKAATRYKTIYNSLNLYKNGVLKETMAAISNFHRSALEMQRFFIRGIKNSFKKIWQNHIKTLISLFDWMTKLSELFGCPKLNDTDVDIPIPTNVPSSIMTDSVSTETRDYLRNNNEKMIHFLIHRKKDHLRKETDDAFERLVQSMNHVSRVRRGNSKSTLACLANNLLLATMFMETISFISALFHIEKPKNKPDSEESNEDWNSSKHDRRSLFLTDFADTDATKQDSSTIFDIL